MKRLLIIHTTLLNWSDRYQRELTHLVPDWELLLYPEAEELEKRIVQAEVILGKPSIDLLPRSAALKWIQTQGAGADRISRALRTRDVVITNASGVHAIPITEHILVFMLSFARNLPAAFRNQLERRWVRPSARKGRSPGLSELAGCTVVLIGTGAIGGHFAKTAEALGMKVIGVRRHPEKGGNSMLRVVGPGALHEVLPEADFLVITAPHTSETGGMVGAEEIALLKQEAYIINTGRGKLIDEKALYTALSEGYIAGAGLDVTAPEPPEPDNPLVKLDNVIVTAHSAFYSEDSIAELRQRTVEAVVTALRGEWPLNLVNPEVKERSNRRIQ